MQFFSCLAIAILVVSSPVNAAERFSIDHYLQLQRLSGIKASPDGDFIAYTIASSDTEDDVTKYAVWTSPLDGGDALRMTSPDSDSHSPAWSNDGRYLAVLSNRKDDTDQVWLYDRRGGDGQMLTDLPQGVDSYAWSPDSQRLLLIAEDATPADLDEEERENPRPWAIDRLQFKEDYVGYLDRYRSHIYVYELSSRQLRQVTFGDFEDSEATWAPDSRHIAFVSNRTDQPDRNRNTDIFIVDTGIETPAPRQLTRSPTADASPSFSPDGKQIVYVSARSGVLPIYAIPELTVVNVDSGETRRIESLAETQVFAPRFGTNSNRIYGIAERNGEQQLVRVNARSGETTVVVGGETVVTEFDIGNDGMPVILAATTARTEEAFAMQRNGLKAITARNDELFAGLNTGEMQKHTLEADDGTPLETFVVLPPDYVPGNRYPGILHIHGGPMAQWDYRFETEAQLLAAQGFVVVMPNPRGSFGYGQDFATAIYRDWGGIDYGDVMSAMDFAVEQGWVDEDRMAVYGWSYGGIMTNNVITKTDRFKAAITGASATLYVANYGHDQYQRWWEEELGLPWEEENREIWAEMSPFYRLQNVKTPTLIVGGEHDWNVPIINSEQLFIGLKRLGVPTQLVVYPNEGHVLSVPSYERDLYERYFAWLTKYVLTETEEE